MTPAQLRLWNLVLRQQRGLTRLIRHRGVEPVDIEDMRQIILTKAWQLIRGGRLVIDPSQDERTAIRLWLRDVALKKIADYWKRRYRRRHVVFVPLDTLLTPPSIEETPRLEAREALKIIRYRLNDKERLILDSLTREDTQRELTALLGVPVGTATTWTYRLRKHLRKALAK
ncbi:MAG: sigma-70 family RNA polymerase sigma factor [Polyangiaceae bacterium]